MSLEKEERRLQRLRGWWQVTTISPYFPEQGRRVHYTRLLERTAVRRAISLNNYKPSWQAIAEPMPDAGQARTDAP